MKKLLFTILIFAATFGLGFSTIEAGFGVSPAVITNDRIKPGTTFTRELVITQSDPIEDLQIEIETDLGEMEDWVRFEPGRSFEIEKGAQRFTMTMLLDVPADAQISTYEGSIRIKALSGAEAVAGGVSIIKGAQLGVNITTTTENIRELSVRAVDIPDYNQGEPLTLDVLIENRGNIPDRPDEINLAISNIAGVPVTNFDTTDIGSIDPGTIDTVSITFDSSLEAGEYFGDVDVLLDGASLKDDKVVFSVFPPQNVSQTQGGVTETNENNGLLLAGIIFSLAIILMITLLIYKSASDKKDQSERAAREQKYVLVFGLVVILGLIVAAAIIATSNVANQTQSTEQAQGTVTTELDTSSIQGATDVNSDFVSQYELYAEPDLNSNVVYIANEGENLDVIDEIDEWFQVQVTEDLTAWLPKQFVKSVETEETTDQQ